MNRKRYTVEQIIHKPRETEVELSQGKVMGHVVRKLGMTEQTYYRWRGEYNTLRPHSSLGHWPPHRRQLNCYLRVQGRSPGALRQAMLD